MGILGHVTGRGSKFRREGGRTGLGGEPGRDVVSDAFLLWPDPRALWSLNEIKAVPPRGIGQGLPGPKAVLQQAVQLGAGNTDMVGDSVPAGKRIWRHLRRLLHVRLPSAHPPSFLTEPRASGQGWV